MDKIEVYSYGAKVAIVGAGSICGTITACCIRDKSVSYEVSYMHDGNHKQAWLASHEMVAEEDKEKQEVGFKVNKNAVSI